MNALKVSSHKVELQSKGFPEIVNINYDLWRLTITLNFEEQKEPVYVTFENIVGFRVLDEGDLLEFWDNEKRASGWIWEIEHGGWFELEKSRNGFVSGHSNQNTEYLILGINDCVSVIGNSKPLISQAE